LKNYWILVFAFFCFACSGNYIYEEKVEIPQAIWEYNNKITYEFNIDDTAVKHNLYLDVTHTDQFPSQNFYTMIHTTYPSGRKVESQISIELADKLGQWYGKCSGETCKLRVVLQQNTLFKEIGLHKIIFEQYTRQKALTGVNALAFSIEEVE